VLEHGLVDNRDIYDGERDDEAGRDGPEEEAVAQRGWDHGKDSVVLLWIHVEERAGEVLDFPGRDKEQEAKRSEGRRAGAIDGLAHLLEPLVAVDRLAQGDWPLPGTVRDEREGQDAQRAHE